MYVCARSEAIWRWSARYRMQTMYSAGSWSLRTMLYRKRHYPNRWNASHGPRFDILGMLHYSVVLVVPSALHRGKMLQRCDGRATARRLMPSASLPYIHTVPASNIPPVHGSAEGLFLPNLPPQKSSSRRCCAGCFLRQRRHSLHTTIARQSI